MHANIRKGAFHGHRKVALPRVIGDNGGGLGRTANIWQKIVLQGVSPTVLRVLWALLPGPALVGLAPAQAIKLRAFSPQHEEDRPPYQFGSWPVSRSERNTELSVKLVRGILSRARYNWH